MTLLACVPPDDPGSFTAAGSTTTSGGGDSTGATPTTTQAETTGASTTDDGGTDGESGGEICGNGGQVRWIRQFDAASHTGYNAMSIAVDGAGNVILVGRFQGVADFGGESFPGGAAYVAKFDTEGDHLWSRQFGAGVDGEHRIDTVAVDEDGTIALGGEFSGSFDLGGGPMMAASFMDVFAANLTADGEHVWSRSFTSSDQFTASRVPDIAIAGGETVFLVDMRDSGDFGGGPIGPLDSNNGFVVKLDAAGGHVWSRAMASGGPWSFQTSALTVDSAGNVWAAGRFEHEASFDDGPPVPVLQSTVYVTRWAADGQLLDVLLTTTQPTTDASFANAMGADANGRVYVGGSFSGLLGFGGEPLNGTGALDGFVAALAGDGAPLWHKAVGQGAKAQQSLFDLAVDAAGRTAITGDFASGIDFGDGVSLAGNLVVDGYVAKLDVDGSPLWARAFGTEKWGNGADVAIDPAGAVYVAGIFRDTLTIDGHSLAAIDDYDTVLMKLCP